MRPAPAGREISAMTRITSALLALASVWALAACGSGTDGHHDGSIRRATAHPTTSATTAPRSAHSRSKPPSPFAVGIRVVTFTDHSRMLQFPGRRPQPRTLVTVIRYPALGPSSDADVSGAAPLRGAGPLPLVVFGHGYDVTPAPYSALLRAWARAGYVVAAPVFPLENANAPGGPDEYDLMNQPGDVSFIISSLLGGSRAPTGFLSGLIDPSRIAVSGQSDGGETALAVAYNRYDLDRRVWAALILSGSKISGIGGFDFPRPSPPLLATQGTADAINPPSFTSAMFDVAPPPKYLLTMFGADHLGPYTDSQPQLSIVERVSLAFLDQYLKGSAGARSRMFTAGNVPGLSAITGRG